MEKKKETKLNKDGTYTITEVIETTPEDGFVHQPDINKTDINHEINKPDIQEIDAFNPDDHYVSLEPVTTNNNEIIDYSALIPKDVENHNNEIPHDTIKPGEIEYFNF